MIKFLFIFNSAHACFSIFGPCFAAYLLHFHLFSERQTVQGQTLPVNSYFLYNKNNNNT